MNDQTAPGPAPIQVVRLFPLRDVILFPHTVLPLHVFEPRYRQMTEDALAGDKGIAIVRLKPGVGGNPAVPSIEDVACLGEIVQHRRLPDGRFNMLLAGRRRVRLRREVPSGKLYRIAEGAVLGDDYAGTEADCLRAELVALCRAALQEQPEHTELGWLWTSELPLGVLADVAAAALAVEPDLRQTLLNEQRVARRVETLLRLLRRLQPGGENTRPFPPPFSTN